MHHHCRQCSIGQTLRVLSLLVFAAIGAGPASQAADDDAAAGPREGKYRMMTYGAVTSPPLHIGSFVLKGNTYQAFLLGDKPAGEGEWKFDAAAKSVTWISGPYKDVWGGEFTVEREGKTHKVRLKRNTIAVNSTDAP